MYQILCQTNSGFNLLLRNIYFLLGALAGEEEDDSEDLVSVLVEEAFDSEGAVRFLAPDDSEEDRAGLVCIPELLSDVLLLTALSVLLFPWFSIGLGLTLPEPLFPLFI
jgi:hypothetical protein